MCLYNYIRYIPWYFHSCIACYERDIARSDGCENFVNNFIARTRGKEGAHKKARKGAIKFHVDDVRTHSHTLPTLRCTVINSEPTAQ